MEKKYCLNCNELENYQLKEEKVKRNISGYNIEYIEKKYICDKCHNEIFDEELFNANTHEANKKLREQANIITTEEIEEILNKYAIGKKPLSLLLGFGEVTIIRYLEGVNPTRENSNLLKLIKDNPDFFEVILIANKDNISEVAFKKALGKTKQLELSSQHSKIYQITLYILKYFSETTPLALQKILYFINGFSHKFLDHQLFNEEVEAQFNGPVYRQIYDCFSYYKNETIDYEEILKDYKFDLNDEEKQYLNNIILLFASYSGSILREMSHLTSPWIEARKGLDYNERSNRIIPIEDINKYFNEVVKTYHINDISDIKKYIDDLYDKVLEMKKINC